MNSLSDNQSQDRIALEHARLYNLPTSLSTTPVLAATSGSHAPSGIPWVSPTGLQDLPADYLGADAAAYLASQQQQQQQQQLPLQMMTGAETSPPPPKKRGRPSGTNRASRDGQDDKASSIQEKNRQAQARFRERQKEKMCVLENRVQTLETRNKQLECDFRDLDSRKSVLEKVLAMKEEKIRQLENGRQLAKVLGSNEAVKEEAQQPSPAQHAEVRPERETSACDHSGRDLVAKWQDYMKRLSSLIYDAGTSTSSQANADLVSVMTEAFAMFRQAAESRPTAAQTLVSCKLDRDMESPDKPEHWARVVHAMGLTEAQKQAVQRLTLQFRAKMVGMWTPREHALTTLASEVPDLSSCRLLALRAVQASSAIAKLQQARECEHREHLEYIIAVLDQTLTKRQLADACTASYPHFPDPLMFCSLLDPMATITTGFQ